MKPIDITPADNREMMELFQNESDRGAAVLAGSYVENMLGIFLQTYLVDKSLSKIIFGVNGSLSTFDQRIDFAQGFGFLPATMCSQLHLIRKIRNHFAHHPKSASFSQSPVKEWISAMRSIQDIEFHCGRISNVSDPKTVYLLYAMAFLVLANEKIHGYGNPEV